LKLIFQLYGNSSFPSFLAQSLSQLFS